VRLFVAVWPPPDVLDVLRGLARPTVEGLRWTTEDQWHVTLKFLGDAEVAAASESLADVDAARTTAVMGPATARFGNGLLQVPVSGLDDVAAAVAASFGPDDRPFRGHLTLGRSRQRRRADLRRLCGVPLAAQWPVEEITLVASQLHPGGARYEIVARRPLG
jgi:2'-5' RNA ligase